MKTLILASLMVVGLGAGLTLGNGGPANYSAPAHNYYQNNWMNS